MFGLFSCKHVYKTKSKITAGGNLESTTICKKCGEIIHREFLYMDRDSWVAIGERRGFAIYNASSTKPDVDYARVEWWNILGVAKTATKTEINTAWKKLSKKYHPDVPGGSVKKMAELNVAKDTGLKQAS